jgi:large subunit ribosomal protein L15
MIKNKTHKRKKASRMHGRKMGTHGWGARKKHKKSGHRGGTGMSGTGKRSDQKKTWVLKKYGHNYFGKQGITSRGTKRDTRQRINLQTIEDNLEKYGKKVGDKWEINLSKYKILGTGEIKDKLIIIAKEASKSAIEKVKKAGGNILIGKKVEKVVEKKKVEGKKKENAEKDKKKISKKK